MILYSATELIRRKRNGERMEPDEIRAFLSGVVDGSIPDYQTSAMLMAIYFRGMTGAELADFTAAMIDSGDRIDIETDLPKVDKHSTGGVGDKVSIALAPLAASCGVSVPMMSGRGLGHTGGTLDKLESIRGFRTSFSAAQFGALTERHGAIIAGQSERIVPADRALYALRDATATVGSIPLICSSIMSKKLAEGLDALVLDIKVGGGAFMADVDSARRLAETMLRIGQAHGVRMKVFLTGMDEPLGREVGNANEVSEAISILRGKGPPDLTELVRVLATAMLTAVGLERAAALVERAIESGEALSKLKEMIVAQGGDGSLVDEPERLPGAEHARRLRADRDGYVSAIDAREIGLAAMRLGAGRQTVDDTIDHGAGITLSAKRGDVVRRGDVLATLRFNDHRHIDAATRGVGRAYRLDSRPPIPTPLVLEDIG